MEIKDSREQRNLTARNNNNRSKPTGLAGGWKILDPLEKRLITWRCGQGGKMEKGRGSLQRVKAAKGHSAATWLESFERGVESSQGEF